MGRGIAVAISPEMLTESWTERSNIMKLTRRILIFSILTAVLSAIGFGFTFWFDQYPKIPWEQETVRLKNLNHFLKNNPETIGRVIYQWTNKGEKKEMRLRAIRARCYLIHELKLDQSRIVVIDGKADC